MTEDRIFYLLQAYTNRMATKEEEQELFQWVAANRDDSYIKEYIRQLVDGDKHEKFKDVEWDRLYRKVLRKARVGRRPFFYMTRGWNKIVAAAVLILVIGTGTYFLLEKTPESTKQHQSALSYYHGDIEPGSTKAIIQAGNSKVNLYGRDTSFELDGNMIYIQGGKLITTKNKPVTYTVTTPRGGDYKIELADGTEVWLNADSKLTYLSTFDKHSREVQLTGEAYFDVYDDATRPFIVNTAKQRIQVLGTEFNVQAYADEAKVTTTLVKGEIKVSSSDKNNVLRPGDQISTGADGRLTIVSGADVEQAIAWKNGYFRFDKTDIYTIMNQLSRWYAVNISYEGKIPEVYFGALISRNNNISQILHLLEATGDVHFKINGRNITVMP